jgi:bifunctional non-homologous end joining protein LigD
MTPVLPELRNLPAGLVLDGELLAWKGPMPWFPNVCRRILNSDLSVPLSFVVFDVLRIDGTDITDRPYSSRRDLLESLDLNVPWWATSETFDDGHALCTPVCEHGLEGWSRRGARAATSRTSAAGSS